MNLLSSKSGKWRITDSGLFCSYLIVFLIGAVTSFFLGPAFLVWTIWGLIVVGIETRAMTKHSGQQPRVFTVFWKAMVMAILLWFTYFFLVHR